MRKPEKLAPNNQVEASAPSSLLAELLESLKTLVEMMEDQRDYQLNNAYPEEYAAVAKAHTVIEKAEAFASRGQAPPQVVSQDLGADAAAVATARSAESVIEEIVSVLKANCDRSWTNETPVQVANIAANAIYWRNNEIKRLRAELDSIANCGMLIACEACKSNARRALVGCEDHSAEEHASGLQSEAQEKQSHNLEAPPHRETGAAGRTYQPRSIKLLRDTLSMLCHFVWHKDTRPGDHMWSIPVDKERDFDCILSDAITELEQRRASETGAKP